MRKPKVVHVKVSDVQGVVESTNAVLEAFDDLKNQANLKLEKFQKDLDSTEHKLQTVQQRATILSEVAEEAALMPPELFNQVFPTWNELVSGVALVQAMTSAELASIKAKADADPLIAWKRNQVKAAIAQQEAILKTEREAKEKADKEAAEQAAAEAKAKVAAELAHRVAVNEAVETMKKVNHDIAVEVTANGKLAEWRKVAVELRGEAVRSAHKKVGGKPTAFDVRRQWAVLLDAKIDTGMMKHVYVGDELVKSRYYADFLAAIVEWADKQHVAKVVSEPAKSVETVLVGQLPLNETEIAPRVEKTKTQMKKERAKAREAKRLQNREQRYGAH